MHAQASGAPAPRPSRDRPMPRVDAVWASEGFQVRYRRIRELERSRPYCGHGLDHLLDVARLMWVRVLEDGPALDRELVYAAALLHDIGRADEYLSGEPHDAAGARAAREILESLPEGTRFPPADVDAICAAVRAHRSAGGGPLAELLRACDRLSRECLDCPSRAGCKWPDGKKNLTIRG